MAAVLFINAWVHILPSLATQTYSPGLVSALVLYLPLSIVTYYRAIHDRALSQPVISHSLILGVVWMLLPFAFQAARFTRR